MRAAEEKDQFASSRREAEEGSLRDEIPQAGSGGSPGKLAKNPRILYNIRLYDHKEVF